VLLLKDIVDVSVVPDDTLGLELELGLRLGLGLAEPWIHLVLFHRHSASALQVDILM